MTEEVNEEELWVFSPRVKLFKASHCFWGCIRRWCCLSLQWYKRKHPGQKAGCHWSSVAGNIPHWLQDTIIVRLQGSTRGSGKEKLLLLKVNLFTFHLFDAAQSVLQGVQCGRLVIVPLLMGQVTLELFQGFNYLLLRLGFGRLLTATVAQPQTCTAASQILHNHYLRQKWRTHRTQHCCKFKRVFLLVQYLQHIQDTTKSKTRLATIHQELRGSSRDVMSATKTPTSSFIQCECGATPSSPLVHHVTQQLVVAK